MCEASTLLVLNSVLGDIYRTYIIYVYEHFLSLEWHLTNHPNEENMTTHTYVCSTTEWQNYYFMSIRHIIPENVRFKSTGPDACISFK